MLAAIVERPHEFVIKDIPRPDAGPKQVIIKTLACSICNATDNHILEGIFDGYHDRYPQIMGHEVCGEVVWLGAEVTDRRLGWRSARDTP